MPDIKEKIVEAAKEKAEKLPVPTLTKVERIGASANESLDKIRVVLTDTTDAAVATEILFTGGKPFEHTQSLVGSTNKEERTDESLLAHHGFEEAQARYQLRSSDPEDLPGSLVYGEYSAPVKITDGIELKLAAKRAEEASAEAAKKAPAKAPATATK